MEHSLTLEMIGYIGSALVVVSMMMTSMIKLRFFNAAGCVFSVIYAILIFSIPVLALNSILFVVNTFQIIRHYTKKRNYDIIDAEVAGFTFRHFLNKNRKKIVEQNPTFFHHYPDSNYSKVVFCDDTVIGMIIGRKENEVLSVYMDYIDKNYWNKELINKLHLSIHNDGINKEIFKTVPKKYEKYYTKAGCTKVGEDFIYDFNLS